MVANRAVCIIETVYVGQNEALQRSWPLQELRLAGARKETKSRELLVSEPSKKGLPPLNGNLYTLSSL